MNYSLIPCNYSLNTNDVFGGKPKSEDRLKNYNKIAIIDIFLKEDLLNEFIGNHVRIKPKGILAYLSNSEIIPAIGTIFKTSFDGYSQQVGILNGFELNERGLFLSKGCTAFFLNNYDGKVTEVGANIINFVFGFLPEQIDEIRTLEINNDANGIKLSLTLVE